MPDQFPPAEFSLWDDNAHFTQPNTPLQPLIINEDDHSLTEAHGTDPVLENATEGERKLLAFAGNLDRWADREVLPDKRWGRFAIGASLVAAAAYLSQDARSVTDVTPILENLLHQFYASDPSQGMHKFVAVGQQNWRPYGNNLATDLNLAPQFHQKNLTDQQWMMHFENIADFARQLIKGVHIKAIEAGAAPSQEVMLLNPEQLELTTEALLDLERSRSVYDLITNAMLTSGVGTMLLATGQKIGSLLKHGKGKEPMKLSAPMVTPAGTIPAILPLFADIITGITSTRIQRRMLKKDK